MRRLGPALLLFVLLAGAARAAELPAWTGQQADVETLTVRVARSPAQWRALWDLAGMTPPRDLAPHETGAAVFLGRRPTAGYGVALRRVERERGVETVLFAETRPGDMAAQVVTSPWLVLVLPRRPILVTFLEETEAARLIADSEIARLTTRLAEIRVFDSKREAFCAERLADCQAAAARLEALIGSCGKKEPR